MAGDLLAECALQLRASSFDFEVLLGASVTSVWQALGRHVSRQLTHRKGVSLQQLGKFGFYKVQSSMQPPVFLLADRFASTYGVVWRHRPPPAPLTATAEANMSALGNDVGLGSDQTRRALDAILTFIGKKLLGGESAGRLVLPGVGSFSLDGRALSFTFDASLLRGITQSDHVETPPPSAIFKRSALDNMRRKTMQLDTHRTHDKGESPLLQRSISLDGVLQAQSSSKHHATSALHLHQTSKHDTAVNHRGGDHAVTDVDHLNGKKQEKEKKRHRHRHRQELDETIPVDSTNTEPVSLNGRQILPRFLIPEPRIPLKVLKARRNHDQVVQAAFQREVANIEQAKRVDDDFNDMLVTRQRVVQIHDLQKRAEQSVARRELNAFLSNQIEEKQSRSRQKSASTYRDVKILPLGCEISDGTRRAEKQKLNQRLNEQVAAKVALKKDRRSLDQAESAYFISKLKMQDEIDRNEQAERKCADKEALLVEWSQQKAIRAQKKTLHIRNGSTIQLDRTEHPVSSIVLATGRMTSRRHFALVVLLALLLAVTEWPQKCLAVDVGEAEDSASSSCPNVTTVSIYGSSSNATKTSSSSNVQITVASTCKSSVVKASTSSAGLRTLDLRSRAIAVVESLPAVNTIRLDNNQLRAFTIANKISALYLANNTISSLDDFKFPSGLTVLDLANNALGDIDNAALPTSLQYLNLSGNPIGSISNVSFPSSLQQLNLVDSSIATLENFSFPSSVTTLNFSSNPITVIRGVIFPNSLTRLTVIATATATTTTATGSVATPNEARALRTVATDPAAQTVSVLEEFEVRQSDADMFEKMSLWDVSTTSTLSCSDSNANPRYVQDTMLCVLSDSEFAAKYESVVIQASSGSTSGSMWGMDGVSSQATERIALKETLHQRRSWFLIGAAALLCAFSILMLVNAFCLCLRRKVRGPSKETGAQSALGKTASGRSNHFWHGGMEPGDEVCHLLSSDPSTITDENSIQPELEPAVREGDSAVKKEQPSDPLTRLSEELQRCEIHESHIKHHDLLSAAKEPTDHGSGETTSPFAYFRAVYHRKTVALKTLEIARHKNGERSSGASGELWAFVGEIRLSSELSHPQLVAFYGFVKMAHADQTEAIDGGGVALVMEYMGKGDLNAFIQSHKQSLQKKQAEIKHRPARANMQEQTNSLVKHVGWDDEIHDYLISGDGSDDDYEEDMFQSDDDVTSSDDQGRWSWRNSSDAYRSKLSIAIEVAQAVQYLHSFSPPLFHGNLSSRKVFLDSDWNVKLGDLTCCSALRRWSSSHKHDTPSSTGPSARGSGRSTTSSQASGEEIHMDMTVWTAPEVLDGRQYTQKADIYSFGVLLAQLATYECSSAEHSVMDDTDVPMLNNAQKEHSADGEAPTQIRLLMLRSQAFQPEVRPTADELLQELQQIKQELTAKTAA
ncbi:hypothetical protein PRNP1_002917 [Phytophthora ramorum]